MSSTLTAPPATTTAPKSPPRGWLLGPGLDAFFLLNLTWPVFAWLAYALANKPASDAFGFMLAFFVIMPHRWITLALVFLDKPRFEQRSTAFLSVAAAIIAFCVVVRLSMESLALLFAVDYLWNAWHFTAQHSGIYGIYGRMAYPARQGSPMYEKVLLRGVILYALMRLAGLFVPHSSVPWLDWVPQVMPYLAWLDWIVLGLAVVLVLDEVRQPSAEGTSRWGRRLYLASVLGLYLSLLFAVRHDWRGVIIGCAAAATLFHSSEYMAVVSWHVKARLKDRGVFAYLAPRWALSLVAFMAFFAVSAYFLRNRWWQLWIWVNLMVSLMHYAYDGMIWKKPKKATA